MVNLFNFENTITINFGRYYMKILFNSIHLFFFSLYVDFYKYRFDCAVKKRLKNGKNISTKKLTQMSDKCICLTVLSKRKKTSFENDQSIKNALVFYFKIYILPLFFRKIFIFNTKYCVPPLILSFKSDIIYICIYN